MEGIEGTAFEIIAKVNGLIQIKDNIFKCVEGKKYYLDKFGFHPVETYNSKEVEKEFTKKLRSFRDSLNQSETKRKFDRIRIDQLLKAVSQFNKSIRYDIDIESIREKIKRMNITIQEKISK